MWDVDAISLSWHSNGGFWHIFENNWTEFLLHLLPNTLKHFCHTFDTGKADSNIDIFWLQQLRQDSVYTPEKKIHHNKRHYIVQIQDTIEKTSGFWQHTTESQFVSMSSRALKVRRNNFWYWYRIVSFEPSSYVHSFQIDFSVSFNDAALLGSEVKETYCFTNNIHSAWYQGFSLSPSKPSSRSGRYSEHTWR